jgi:hypothetical protein
VKAAASPPQGDHRRGQLTACVPTSGATVERRERLEASVDIDVAIAELIARGEREERVAAEAGGRLRSAYDPDAAAAPASS